MAPMPPMTVTAVPPPMPPKIKRPPLPTAQTNGAGPSQQLPSPSISTTKPPPAAAARHNQPPNPTSTGANANAHATTNGAPSGGSTRPTAARSRRDTLSTSGARGPKGSAALRSAGLNRDKIPTQSFEPRPEVKDETAYILKKFAGCPPSLIIHLHPTHFRFDQQDGIFPYKSPMRVFLDHLHTRTIPHDLLPDFTDAGVPFYEGCLIVQIHDHKSVAQAKEVARPASKSNSSVPFSIHNSNPYITPSPYAPFPKENLNTADQGPPNPNKSNPKDGDPENKENGDTPNSDLTSRDSKEPSKAAVYTVVLHPTPESLHKDLMIKATTPKGSAEVKAGTDTSTMPPPTPLSAVPPTPSVGTMPPPPKRQKRDKMEISGSEFYDVESQILLATTAPLHLEVPKSKEDAIALIGQLSDPKHSEPPPKPKIRKRTVAERAADKALAEEQEKFMLTYDERLSANSFNQGTTDSADGTGSSGASSFEPRFERFNTLFVIKKEHAEKKEQERLRTLENERKIALQKQQQAAEQQQQQQQQQRQQAAELEAKRREEAARTAANMRIAQDNNVQRQMLAQQRAQQAQAQQQQQQAQQQQQQQQQQQAQPQAAAAAAHSPQNPQMNNVPQAPHGHPMQNGAMSNGLSNGMLAAQAQRFAQGASQAPVSSPIVRQNTPQNMSSPMVGNVPMSQTNSGMGGSPPRPSSVVQNQVPISVPMAVSRSQRGSQQSHPSNTPRMPSATPQMPHGTPINRPMPTPRMTQASPPPGMMAHGSPMGQNMHMGHQNMGQPIAQQQMLAAQMAAQQQQARQRAVQQHQQNQQLQAMMNGQNPQLQQQLQQQQQMYQQQHLRQQMMQQLGNPQNPAMLNHAQQQMLRYQAAQQAQMQGQMQGSVPGQMGGPHMGNQNFVNVNGITPAQAAMMQQQLQQRGQVRTPMNMQQQMSIQHIRNRQAQLYTQSLPALISQFGGEANIPPDVMERFKASCLNKAQQDVAKMRQLQIQQQQAQAQAQQQQQQQQQQQLAQQNDMANMGMMQQGMQ
ncbi:hypothetical protein GGR55DRAFT_653223 [Xylaria sp. FL0064]|nr:hypothetical protein GGR55DRAFT_653223 [Xylaria sp. FL0064]